MPALVVAESNMGRAIGLAENGIKRTNLRAL